LGSALFDEQNESYLQLVEEIARIGERCREAHVDICLNGVDHTEMKSALEDVLHYWKDSIRPALIYYSYEAVSGKPKTLSHVASFFSISGAGIGIHDDVIDRTLEKHGRNTIHGSFGGDKAITVGDLLIVKGLCWIREALKDFDTELVCRVLEEYERFFTEMCMGEMAEINCRRNLDVGLEEYNAMLWKLGVDTEACCKIGAILGGGSEQEIKMLGDYGRHLGYLNRLHDELRDTVNWGGNLVSRLAFESIPLPVLYSVKNNISSYTRVKEMMEKSDLSTVNPRDIFVLCHFDKAFSYVHGLAEVTVKNGLESIEGINNNRIREKLGLLLFKLGHDIKKMGE
jgi:geranylgeranyl diphosphate synthase, type I